MLPGHTEKGQVAAQSGEKPVPTLHWVGHISQLEGPRRSLHYSTERLWESVTASSASVSWLARLVLETRLQGRSLLLCLAGNSTAGWLCGTGTGIWVTFFLFLPKSELWLLPPPPSVHSVPLFQGTVNIGQAPLALLCGQNTSHVTVRPSHVESVLYLYSSTWGGWKLQDLAKTSFFEK